MMMDRLPRLLNRDELSHSLRRFYPEKERRAGREGSVKVKLHIGIDGRVGRVEIMESKGKSFDKAAKSVAKRMRFSPAMFNGRLVAVRLRQTIIFRLED